MTSIQKRNALHLIAAGALSVCATGLLGACSEKKAEFRGVDVTGAEYARDIPLTDHNGQLLDANRRHPLLTHFNSAGSAA